LREVYGSGIYTEWLEKISLSAGLVGCLLAGGIVLVNAWYGVRGTHSPKYLNSCILLAAAGSFLPILVLSQGRWRRPLKQRKSVAVTSLFDNQRKGLGPCTVIARCIP